MKNSFKHQLSLHYFLWSMALLCLIFASPQTALADEFDNAYNWTAYSVGQGKIHMKLMYADLHGQNWYVQNSDGKCGYVTVQDNTNQKHRILSFYEDDEDNDGDEAAWRWCHIQSHYGVCVITNVYPSSTGDVRVSENGQWYRLQKTAGEAGPCYIELDWYYPAELSGRTGDFYIDLNIRHRSDIHWQQFASGLEFTSVDADKPTLMEPQLAPDPAHAGQIMLGYQMQKEPRTINVEFYSSRLGDRMTSVTPIETTERAGFVYFDAYNGAEGRYKGKNSGTTQHFSNEDVEPFANTSLLFHYVYSTNDKGEPVSFNDTRSDEISIPLLHNPRNLRIRDMANGDTRVLWSVVAPDYTDIMPDDIFEIQRATDSDFSDAQTIGTVDYVFGNSSFEYVDTKESFMQNYHEGQKYYYRVRRQAQAIWGWQGCAEDSIKKNLFLLQPESATAEKTNNWQQSHEVKLSWKLESQRPEDSQGMIAGIGVYDERSQMKVTIEMLGKNGNVLYTEQGMYPHAQLETRELLLKLDRSCVDFKFKIEVIKGASTLPFYGEEKTVYAQNKDDFRYNNFGSITNLTATKGEHPEYVELEWEVDDGDIDYFKVMRSLHGRYDWSTIKTDLLTTFYRDATALPLEDYDYQVIGITVCEDYTNESKSEVVTGNRQHTAYVDGNVRYPDGTAAAGVKLILDPPVTTIASGDYLDFSTSEDSALGNDSGNDVTGNEPGHYVVQSNGEFKLPKQFTLQMLIVNKDFTGTLFENGNVKVYVNEGAHGKLLRIGKATGAYIGRDYQQITFSYDGETDYMRGWLSEYDFNSKYAGHTKLSGSPGFNGNEDIASKILLGISKDLQGEATDLFSKLSSYGGCIDEVRIYDRLFTDEELDAARTLKKNTGTEEGLILYWDFENDNANIRNKAEGGSRDADATTYLLKSYDDNLFCIDSSDTEDGKAYTKASIVKPDSPYKLTKTGNIEAVTDENGHYVISGIPYSEESTFTVTPVNTGDGNKFEPETQSVTFTTQKNVYKNIDFTLTTTYKMTATVLYYGSSIPVQNANVKLNGNILHNATGEPVVTNNNGEVSFRMPKGKNTIQVVKDGHIFLDEGYYMENESRDIEVEKDIPNVYFWDKTKVKVIGRICGGSDQGNLPVGKDLSHNNLGDSLLMVMALEGDNTSWIVRDQLNSAVKEYRETITHHDGKHKTDYYANRHRIEIRPDKNSGEFVAYLYPVKYKITEISAKGYATLFQEGKVGEVIDLTDSVKSYNDDGIDYNAIFRHVYHSPINLTCEQYVPGRIPFLGEKQYRATNSNGDEVLVPIVEFVTDPVTNTSKPQYVFGHPVFDQNRTYVMNVSAHEDYYYNNVKDSLPDKVMMHGGKLKVYNGLVSGTEQIDKELDENGECQVTIKASDVSYTVEGENALKSLSMSVEIDSAFIEAETIRAYVMGSRPKEQGKQLITNGNTYLFDILRDPPGSGSSAYIEEGTTMAYSYKRDFTLKGGFAFTVAKGSGKNGLIGTVQGPVIQADIFSASTDFSVSTDITTTYHFDKAYKYSFTAKKRISTSSGSAYVGTDGDVFIGVTEAMVIKDAIAVRCVDDVMLEQVKANLQTGAMKEIATGTASDGKKYYLIRDEVLSLGTQINSSFAYTQRYIEFTLIPNLLKLRNSLLFTGTKEEALAKANYTHRPVYWTKRDVEADDFGVDNVEDGKRVEYNTTREDLSYMIVLPDGVSKAEADTIHALNHEISTWVGFLGQNEREKIEAYDKVGTYSVSGGTSFSYSDTYTGSLDQSRYIKWPFANGAALNFSDVTTNLKNTVHLEKTGINKKDNITGYSLEFGGFKIDLKFKPIFDISDNYNNGKSESASKTIGCTVATDPKGDLTFEILRTNTIKYDSLKTWVQNGQADVVLGDINDYYDKTHDKGLMDYINDEQKGVTKYGSLVYRTLAGSSKCPYEDERKTKYYSPGVVYDAKTKKIENPKLIIDKHEVSNVPADQPAKFMLTMFNDTEIPEAAPFTFDLVQLDGNNSKGAQLFIDGVPISDGRTFAFGPGDVMNKVLEVYCGEGYDFEDLGLRLGSQCDVNVFSIVNLSVHFIPSAGNIHVSTPTDKWVMNTESAYDNGYYLPVKIDGYNVNHRGFDHIELQYKLSTQSDRDWVNICSYYDDEQLMAKASGTCSLIGNNGYIEGRLYGEKDPVEQYYDLRAVVYCRNGNDFVTSSSPVLSGIKDTRRPTVFGNPQPADGVLNIDDDIMVKFSENIAGNYLSKVNNFEVTGLSNSTEITQNTSLEFTGNGYLMTEAKRNLATKNITVEMLISPDFSGGNMPLFSHGADDNKLEFWVMADGKLRATINGLECISTKSLDFGGFRQVAMTLNQDTHILKFFAGGDVIGEFNGVPEYEGSTVLVFGTDHENKHYYKGNMLEARLWYRELGGQELTQYGFKRLTGYETGLVDYYMLNEGDGIYAQDKAQGATAKLYNLGWTLPKGLSLHIDFEDNGVKLNDRLFQRTAEQDYTLMFWFKTDQTGRGALLSNGEGKLTDADYKNKFFIGFEGRELIYRSGGMEIKVPGTYDDNVWHQYAMTVNRPRNIGHIYLDHVLRATFGLDSLGGISGDRLYLGSKHYVLKDQQGTEYQMNNLRGDIDELVMFEQVMPENVIKNYYNVSPSGREMGLMVHAPFSKYERQLNNTIQAVPSMLSTRVYRDAEGNILENKVDTVLANVIEPVSGEILVDAESVFNKHVNKETFAPVRDRGELENLNYSFTAKDNELVINLNEPDWKIEKTNVYVTIREVPDLNGNYMASPTTFSFFVDRNQLRWKDKYVTRTVKYGEGDSFDVLIENKGGSLRNYQIEGMPDWMDITPYMGSISALDQESIHIDVSPDLNVGSYDVVLFLRNDNDVCERLSMVINVEGERPNWAVTNTRNYTMNILARAMINDAIDTDTADVVGVFDKLGNCLGVSHINLDVRTGETFVYLTVFDDDAESKQLYFKLWDASTGITYVTTQYFLSTPTKVAKVMFDPNTLVGSIDNPLILSAGTTFVQKLSLKEGWNWVSFNVYNTAFRDITNVLSGFNWKVGDQLKDPMAGAILDFTEKGWVRNDKTDRLELKNDRMYAVKVSQDVDVEISGGLLTSIPQRTINLVEQWNYIGYTPNVNLPITTALSEYFDYANDGDMVKSQHEFAVFRKYGDHDGEWKGNLKYLKTGEGYMLFRNSNTDAQFTYPFVKPGTSFFDGSTNKAQAPVYHNSFGSSMALIALPTGIEIQPGDRLIAYGDAEIRGVAEADEDGNFYISIGGDKQVPLAFGIEREGLLVALTPEVMSYHANEISGKPDNPTRIDFVKTDFADGYWYTLQGVRLNHKPAQSGVYIFNGKKVVVK